MSSVSRETKFSGEKVKLDLLQKVFGKNYPKAMEYAEILTSLGIERGLIGPREAGRIWDRHILNCAVLASYLPSKVKLLDIGTGAGLPAIPLILAKENLQITALEPLLRRVEFLELVKQELDLNIQIVRGRAEEKSIQAKIGKVEVVTSRAVANLGKLAEYAKPYLTKGGKLLALKGDLAQQELADNLDKLNKLHFSEWQVIKAGSGILVNTTNIITGKLS